MDRKSTQNLRLDRRLIRRRDWISKSELEREMEGLPDISDKAAPPEPEPEAGAEEKDPPLN